MKHACTYLDIIIIIIIYYNVVLPLKFFPLVVILWMSYADSCFIVYNCRWCCG